MEEFLGRLRNCTSPPLSSDEPVRISVEAVLGCHNMTNMFRTSTTSNLKYNFQLMEEKEIDFHMIRTNFTKVRNILDGMRKRRKKFVCLNDDIDHTKPESELVVMALQELYDAYFPERSTFELPDGEENAHLYYSEFVAARQQQKLISSMAWASVVFVLLVVTSRCALGRIRAFSGAGGSGGGGGGGSRRREAAKQFTE